ncbi:MAG: hypothetical protein IPF66_06990 [Holophagales bacterium]|nr:hypothetical protein [Holophagales bacterium]
MTGRARIAEAGTVSHSASRTLLAGAILLLLTAAGALAAPVRIVTAGELSAEISATGRTPVVLDARPSRDFRAGHVPGSLRVDWRDFSESRPGIASYLFGDPARWGLLAVDRASLLDRLRALGMSSSRPVVVVGDPSGWGEEGRVAWMLLYLGHPEVALLDGGFPAWAVENPGRIERDAAHAPSGDFEPEPQPDRRIRLEALRAAIAVGSVTLLDARTAEEFAGKRLRGQKRGGPDSRCPARPRGLAPGGGRSLCRRADAREARRPAPPRRPARDVLHGGRSLGASRRPPRGPPRDRRRELRRVALGVGLSRRPAARDRSLRSAAPEAGMSLAGSGLDPTPDGVLSAQDRPGARTAASLGQ